MEEERTSRHDESMTRLAQTHPLITSHAVEQWAGLCAPPPPFSPSYPHQAASEPADGCACPHRTVGKGLVYPQVAAVTEMRKRITL